MILHNDDYTMNLVAYIYFDTHQLMDERVYKNAGHTVEKLRFASTLKRKIGNFEKGQTIT